MSGRTNRAWDGVNALYQVYIRSFQDSSSDGVGDIRGITSRLDYLKDSDDSLGVDALLLTPFYASPMVDYGYDVVDHCAVDPKFGTLQDFDELVAEAHKRNIKIMVDLIPNHTSDQHSWFLESRSSRQNPKRNWYIWHDPKKGLAPPNNWQSKFGGSVWEYDEHTEQYYYHTFFAEQPDLNWENPDVQRAIQDICRFWVDRGVDGLRVDAAIYLAKDRSFQDDPVDDRGRVLEHGMSYGSQQDSYFRNITQFFHEYQNTLVLIEAYPEGKQQTALRYRDIVAIGDEQTAPLVVEGMWLPFNTASFREFLSSTMLAIDPTRHIPVFCFGNHDNQRLVSKFGYEQARAIAIIQMTLPGLPLIYYGEEIGMTNANNITANRADGAVQSHMPLGRGVVRTPMQWENSNHAGFTKGVAWLPHHTNSTNTVNAQINDPDSFLSLYKNLLVLRRKHSALRTGEFVLDDTLDGVLVYSRMDGEEEFITAVNMSPEPIVYTCDIPVDMLISSHPCDRPYVFDGSSVQLQPNEAVILKRKGD
ncbi:alpha-amylase [Candidatus Saccharibacteria bacterium]|nr:alpha-amylase [Candidatus Saccharibacteria bacterium]NCU40640.1 alpha-amylase [Candidatus Saccharibacteria bacterium]